MKGAFLATEAASSLVLYISKVVTFSELGALPLAIITQGLIVGTSIMLGTFAGKAIVLRMNVGTFRYLLDFLLCGSGLMLLWAAFH
jgi:uncharacterized membrane protein YfcA